MLERGCKPHGLQQGWEQGPAASLGQSQAQTHLGWRKDWEQSWGEGWVNVGWAGNMFLQPRKPTLWCDKQVKGGDFLIILWEALVRFYLEHCVLLWAPSIRTRTTWRGFRLEGWRTSSVKRSWESCCFSIWRKKGSGGTFQQPSSA